MTFFHVTDGEAGVKILAEGDLLAQMLFRELAQDS